MTNAELADDLERRMRGKIPAIAVERQELEQIIAALRRKFDLGPQVARYSHGNIYHEPADIAKPLDKKEKVC